jgi:hypothetical protein
MAVIINEVEVLQPPAQGGDAGPAPRGTKAAPVLSAYQLQQLQRDLDRRCRRLQAD